jgi:hypothetical protein
MRNTFAMAEVALALVLMVAAGLMARTFQRVLKVDSGNDLRYRRPDLGVPRQRKGGPRH